MRQSIVAIDMDELNLIEEALYDLLKNLFKSEPDGKPLNEYSGGIRFTACLIPKTKNGCFCWFDFPKSFSREIPEYQKGKQEMVPCDAPQGASISAFSEYLARRISQFLLTSHLRLPVKYLRLEGHGATCWFQLPPGSPDYD